MSASAEHQLEQIQGAIQKEGFTLRMADGSTKCTHLLYWVGDGVCLRWEIRFNQPEEDAVFDFAQWIQDNGHQVID